MRRSILIATGAMALAGAMAVGPFGAAAAAPYVYGCTQASYGATGDYQEALAIYNGSGATATLTHKFLAGNGTIVNNLVDAIVGGVEGGHPPTTSSLLPTHTKVLRWLSHGFFPDESDASTPATIRLVSNVPVAAVLTHGIFIVDSPIAIPCLPLQP
jgi:hypothetical protein